MEWEEENEKGGDWDRLFPSLVSSIFINWWLILDIKIQWLALEIDIVPRGALEFSTSLCMLNKS